MLTSLVEVREPVPIQPFVSHHLGEAEIELLLRASDGYPAIAGLESLERDEGRVR